MTRMNLTGQRYGRWAVIRSADVKSDPPKWVCKCDCGVFREVHQNRLRQGGSLSCGCYNREVSIAVNTSHGGSRSPEYRTWDAMIQRCTNPKHKNYVHYGGRGISVSPEWRKFENFIRDMGPRLKDKGTIERDDVNKGYEPGNCRWASQEEQSNNTRRSVYLEFRGERRTIRQWATCTGIHYNTLKKRLKSGWSIERILTSPPGGKK